MRRDALGLSQVVQRAKSDRLERAESQRARCISTTAALTQPTRSSPTAKRTSKQRAEKWLSHYSSQLNFS